MDFWTEIITGVERRRRWRLEDKLQIVAEAESPGAIVSHVARRHLISRGLLSNWRQKVRRRAPTVENHAPLFMPMHMLPEPMGTVASVPPPRLPPASTQVMAADRRIELALHDDTCIRVGKDVGLTALRRVIAAVRR